MVQITQQSKMDVRRLDVPEDRILLALKQRDKWKQDLDAQCEGLEQFLEQEEMGLARASSISEDSLKEIEKMAKSRRKLKVEGE